MRKDDLLNYAAFVLLGTFAVVTWTDSKPVAVLAALGAVLQLVMLDLKARRRRKTAAPAEFNPAEFDVWYHRMVATARQHDFIALGVIVALLGLYVASFFGPVFLFWWQAPVDAAVIGTLVGVWWVRRKRMAELKAVHDQIVGLQQMMMGAAQAWSQGAIVVGVLSDSADGEPPMDEPVTPDHPMWGLLTGAMEHGGAAFGKIVKTDDGWEVLHGSYPDGTEYGIHEPAHEERLT